MANTHDYIISNDTGSNVRGDLNTLLLEIEASNAGDSAPSNVAAGKLWHDTTTDTLKYYTGAQWVSIGRQVKGSANDTDITGTIDPIASTTVTGVGTVFTTEAKIGDKIVVTGETRTITAIASDTSLTVDVAFSNNANDTTPEIHPAAFVVTDDSSGVDLIIDTDGKVGISTPTPTAQVDVRGSTGTGTGTAGVLRLSTAELTVADGDQLGRIEFVAPLEASGTDAILVGASIYAEADDTFASDNNATDLVFATGASEAAAEKLRITSAGGISGSTILDEDAMGSDSATKLATQQSIKAYVDSAASQATTAAQGVGTGNSPTFAAVNVTGGKLDNLASSVWALTASTTATSGDLTAWAECALNSYGGVGALPTLSTGVFTFPYTGNWLITAHMESISGGTDTTYLSSAFSLTENNGTNWYAGMGSGQSTGGGGGYAQWSHAHMFDVTDLANDKLKVIISNPWGAANTATISGINTSVAMYSCLVFQLLSE